MFSLRFRKDAQNTYRTCRDSLLVARFIVEAIGLVCEAELHAELDVL